jgi:CTP:molybdopterin cytidylyltransferase MocA
MRATGAADVLHGLVLAGGEGSRLAADGVTDAKALVRIQGRPQLVALAETFLSLGCATVTCMVRDSVEVDEASPPWAHLPSDRVRVLRCRTPSSLHTLVEGLARVPAGPVLASMVDTVLPAAEWRRVAEEMRAALAGGAAAAILTTPFVDDERPLYVRQDADGRVRDVGPEPGNPVRVTGGAYAFTPRARTIAAAALAAGRERMRALLGILARETRVVAVEAAKVIDLDHGRDLDAARAWLADQEPTPASTSTGTPA